jgi:hypothetical protein
VPAFSEFFVADHRSAVRYATALEAGESPSVDLPRLAAPEVTDLDVEVLGELAAATVHAGGTDCALGMVDVELEELYVIPEPLAAVFAELKDLEDQEDVSALAASWAHSEEMSSSPASTEPLVRALSELASLVDEEGVRNLYFWNYPG